MFESITGHTKQIELLNKAMQSGKLAHAYVFAGPDGVGKKTIAKRLALELLDQKSISLENYFHPDFLEINGLDGVKIEQIRELAYKLSLKPYQAKHKVALIDNAEEMTTEAANALLKVLEEPKSFTYLFLVTNNPNKLPKTILSRCQKINFGPLKNQEINLGREDQTALFETFMTDKAADRLIVAYEIADMETEEIKSLLDMWLKKLQMNLQSQATKKLANKISQVMLSRKFLDQNVNSKLLLTNLMLNT